MRIAQYLESFDTRDWRSFRTFIDQRTQKHSDIAILTQYIHENRLKNLKDLLNPDRIRKNLFTSKSRKNIMNLYSNCVSLIKEYLILDQLENENYERQILLIKALNRRKLYKEADRLVDKSRQQLTTEKISWWNGLYQQRVIHEHYFSDNPSKNESSYAELQFLINSTERYHEQMRALYHFETHNSLKLNKISYLKIADSYEHDADSKNEISIILNKLFKVRIENNHQEALELRNILNKKHKELSDDLRLLIYLVLRMFYAREANRGKLEMAIDIFELHKLMTENKYLISNKQISEFQFLAIVELCSFLGETEWGHHFVSEHHVYLPFKQKREILELSNSYLLFGEGNFQESLDNLQKVYPKTIRVRAMTNRLELLNFYKINKDDQLFLYTKIKNFKLYNYRNKKHISKKAYLGSTNFARILKLLIDNADTKIIKERIDEMDVLFYRLFFYKEMKMGPSK